MWYMRYRAIYDFEPYPLKPVSFHLHGMRVTVVWGILTGEEHPILASNTGIIINLLQ